MELNTDLDVPVRLTIGEVAALCGTASPGVRIFGNLMNTEDEELLAAEGHRSLVARGLVQTATEEPSVSPVLSQLLPHLTRPDGVLSLTTMNSDGARLAVALVLDDSLVATHAVADGVSSFAAIDRNELDELVLHWLSEDVGDRHIHLRFEPIAGATIDRTWVVVDGILTCDGRELSDVPQSPCEGLVFRSVASTMAGDRNLHDG